TEPEEQVRRTPSEIAQVLRLLEQRKEPVTAYLQGGDVKFTSKLCVVDPVRRSIVVDAEANEAANAALLSRPRCTFFGVLPAGLVEFVAADPEKITHEGKPAIRLKFPDVVAVRQRRGGDRTAVSQQVPLECVADEGGVLSFKGGLVDISVGG